ncbi:MAG: flagellar basal body rod protein FlgB [Hyphomonadaceae bacterium]
MDVANSPFFSLLRGRLDQLSQRQQLIAENIANASTPGYRPRDVDTSSFERMVASAQGGGLAMARTQPGHMSPNSGAGGQARVITRDDSETTIDGNAVVLEEQMARAAETRTAFETGLALYQKGLDLLRLAARAPGR